jgi:hypothetical protein
VPAISTSSSGQSSRPIVTEQSSRAATAIDLSAIFRVLLYVVAGVVILAAFAAVVLLLRYCGERVIRLGAYLRERRRARRKPLPYFIIATSPLLPLAGLLGADLFAFLAPFAIALLTILSAEYKAAKLSSDQESYEGDV